MSVGLLDSLVDVVQVFDPQKKKNDFLGRPTLMTMLE